jgi:hypothetical protein
VEARSKKVGYGEKLVRHAGRWHVSYLIGIKETAGSAGDSQSWTAPGVVLVSFL